MPSCSIASADMQLFPNEVPCSFKKKKTAICKWKHIKKPQKTFLTLAKNHYKVHRTLHLDVRDSVSWHDWFRSWLAQLQQYRSNLHSIFFFNCNLHFVSMSSWSSKRTLIIPDVLLFHSGFKWREFWYVLLWSTTALHQSKEQLCLYMYMYICNFLLVFYFTVMKWTTRK